MSTVNISEVYVLLEYISTRVRTILHSQKVVKQATLQLKIPKFSLHLFMNFFSSLFIECKDLF